jgi:hypothetical protein
MEQQTLLPARDQNRSYPIAYAGTCCDTAIRADNAPMLKECVERDFIDQHSELLDGKTVLQFCIQDTPRPKQLDDGTVIRVWSPRAPQCAAMLMGLGWTIPTEKGDAFGIR